LHEYSEIKPDDEIVPRDKVRSLVLEAEDHVLASGRMGLASNKAGKISFDFIHIAPLKCHIIPPLDSTFYRTNICNRM